MHAHVTLFRFAIIEKYVERFQDRGLTRIVLANERGDIVDFDASALSVATKILKDYRSKFHGSPPTR